MGHIRARGVASCAAGTPAIRGRRPNPHPGAYDPDRPIGPGGRVPEEDPIWWNRSSSVPDTVPAPEHERTLELFKYDTCPYCVRVMMALRRMPDVKVTLLDVRRDPASRQRLWDSTGRTQVPCLFVDGEPLFESEDIVRWLDAHHEWLAGAGARGA